MQIYSTHYRSLMLISILLISMLSVMPVQAASFLSQWFVKDEPLQVIINDAFINIHSGPGRGYPIFYVVERDEVITLLKSRTDWIKVETRRGLVGWIKRSDMLLTLAPDGSVPNFPEQTQEDFLEDRWEMGVAYGDFAGADALALNVGYRFTKNLSVELRVDENTGQFSDSQIVAAAVLFQPFPAWRVSPYFSVGAGKIQTHPSATLVATEDRNDDLLQTSFGTYVHVSGRFFARLEYANHYILTSRNTNEEVNEWKVGFSVFF